MSGRRSGSASAADLASAHVARAATLHEPRGHLRAAGGCEAPRPDTARPTDLTTVDAALTPAGTQGVNGAPDRVDFQGRGVGRTGRRRERWAGSAPGTASDRPVASAQLCETDGKPIRVGHAVGDGADLGLPGVRRVGASVSGCTILGGVGACVVIARVRVVARLRWEQLAADRTIARRRPCLDRLTSETSGGRRFRSPRLQRPRRPAGATAPMGTPLPGHRAAVGRARCAVSRARASPRCRCRAGHGCCSPTGRRLSEATGSGPLGSRLRWQSPYRGALETGYGPWLLPGAGG
jgi:hypothetical protein